MSPRDRSADAERPSGFWGRVAARLMEIGHRKVYKKVAAALELKKEDDLLDVGCGSGIFIKKFASQIRFAAGLDHSKDMVDLASRNNRKRVKNGTAEFKLGEAEKLPWKDKSFSAVSTIETFYWLKPLETLKEIFRVLRPGGRVVVGLGLNADDGKDYSNYAKIYDMNFYSENQMRAWLEQAGFSNISFSFSKGVGMPRIMVARGFKLVSLDLSG